MSLAERRSALLRDIERTRESFVRQAQVVRDEVRVVVIAGTAIRLARTVFAFIRRRRRKS